MLKVHDDTEQEQAAAWESLQTLKEEMSTEGLGRIN